MRVRRRKGGTSTFFRHSPSWLTLGLIVLLLACGTAVQSCNLVEKGNGSKANAAAASQPDVDIERLRHAIRLHLTPPSDSGNTGIGKYENDGILYRFYSENDATPVWTKSFVNTTRIDTLMHFLEMSYEHGLQPVYYDVANIVKLRKQFLESTENGGEGDYDALAKLELALSGAALIYASHMRYGVLNPLSVFPNDYFHRVEVRRIDDAALRAGDHIGSYLRGLQPQGPRYALLISALRRLRSLQRTGPVTPIVSTDKKIEPGKHTAVLGAVERRIKYLSQLRIDDNPLRPEADFTSKYDALGYTQYDSMLVDRVKEFQRRNGLLDDGVLGDRSFKAMNLTHDERINQVSIAMERMRWLRMPDSGKYIRVNVPEFYLYAVDNGVTAVGMKVCVGMRYSVYVKGQPGKNYQTPMVSGKMNYIVLNPTWSVPPSIATRETYYQALKDSTYLQRHGYRVLLNNEDVHSTSIKWKDYKPDKLPFRFVQRPGEGNALGRIKFVFENAFDIYLHDTPKRKPFTFASRTVSHGCIRIEQPMRMLDFLLKDHSSWFPQSVTDYLAASRTTKWITLEKKVPVFVDYITVWVDEQGTIQFRDDVYGKDGRIAIALRNRLQSASAAH